MEKVSDEILVEARSVSKKFSKNFKKSLWYGLVDIIKAVSGIKKSSGTLRTKEFWAVKDINFTLRRGECIGLIGHNGAGKSTLLKMLNGLIRPDEGEIIMRGRVGALIELGAGFNPVLTGRENIYINGQILGFSKREIDRKLEDIIKFAEIGDFLDSPVQNYSSGMKVRLGFAVAAQMEPDVLIVDEVLAVGDLGFILKCFNTIDKLLPKTAVIFVSHSMPMISRTCTKIILMENGEVAFQGDDVSKGIDLYYNKFSKSDKFVFSKNDDIEITKVEVTSDEIINGIPIVSWLQDLTIIFKLKFKKSFLQIYFSFTIFDKEQRPVGVSTNYNLKEVIRSKPENEVITFKATLPNILLSKGLYSISIYASEEVGKKPLLRMKNIVEFQIKADKDVWPPIMFNSKWELP
jgi:lipopolysaccharide transport system ATP-binding protein